MLMLRDKQFNIDIEEVLLNLRNEVLLKQERTILNDMKVSGNDILITCPSHSNGNERKPSCGVNTLTGVFHCFTCGIRGHFDKLISLCLGYEDGGEKGFEWLVKNYIDSTYSTRQGLSLKKRSKPKLQTYISEEELDSYRYYHDYMWKRHLTPELVEAFDIGYDDDFVLKNKQTGKETHLKCITFPVKDLSGNVVFIARRCVNQKLFHYPREAEKPIYALDKCIGAKTIYVCESILNALMLWKYGLKAVALLGTGSHEQGEILKQCNFRKIIFCLDGDKAGDAGRDRLFEQLQHTTKLTYLQTPRDGRDINDISQEEFEQLKEIKMN